MTAGRLMELRFYGDEQIQLESTRFEHPSLPVAAQSVRGKTNGAYVKAGSFQWTKGVQAVVELLLSAAAAGADQEPILYGTKGSLAASLAYSLEKQPNWICEMFGTFSKGSPLARRIFRITNPALRRQGRVAIALNDAMMPKESIRVFLNDEEQFFAEQIQNIIQKLG